MEEIQLVLEKAQGMEQGQVWQRRKKGIAEQKWEEEGKGTRPPSFGTIKLHVCYVFTSFQGAEMSSRQVPVELSQGKLVWPEEEMRGGN